MSETPRTDARKFAIALAGGNHMVVFANLSAELERELAALEAQLRAVHESHAFAIDQLTGMMESRRQADVRRCERLASKYYSMTDDPAKDIRAAFPNDFKENDHG